MLAGAGINPFNTFGIRAEFGHGALELSKVIDHSLVNQDVAVSQKQNAFLAAGLVGAPV